MRRLSRIRVTSYPPDGPAIRTSLQLVLWSLGCRLLWGTDIRLDVALNTDAARTLARLGGPVLVRGSYTREPLGSCFDTMIHRLERRAARAPLLGERVTR